MTIFEDASTRQSPPRAAALANMAWLLGDKAFALVAGLAIFGLIARTLGPAGAGHFTYGAAVLQTGLGLSLVCAGVALLPRFCRMQAALPGAIANIFVLRMAASVIATLLVLAYCLLAIADPQRRLVAIIMVCAVPLIEPFFVIGTYWLSRNHNQPTVVARCSGLLARALIVFAAIHYGAPIWVLAAAWMVEGVVNATLQCLQIRRYFPRVRWVRSVRRVRMQRYLAFGVRFLPALWLGQLFLRVDRLVLAEFMDPTSFGLYAAPMQLVEVWAQVAYLVGSSVATAHLYPRLRESDGARAFVVTALAMSGIGLMGLAGAWVLGPWLLGAVFGAAFVGSAGYLTAGAAFAVLLFADQAVEMLITARNQPAFLALKWGTALAVALLIFQQGHARLGAYVGPAGLALGLVCGWLALLVTRLSWGRSFGAPVRAARP